MLVVLLIGRRGRFPSSILRDESEIQISESGRKKRESGEVDSGSRLWEIYGSWEMREKERMRIMNNVDY